MTNKTHANGARIDDAKKFTPAQKNLIREHVNADTIKFLANGTQLQVRKNYYYKDSTLSAEISKFQAQLLNLGIDVYALQDMPATASVFKRYPDMSYFQITFMRNS